MLKKIVFLIALMAAGIAARAQNTREHTGPFPETTTSTELSAKEQKHQRDVYTHHRVKPFTWKKNKVTHTAQYEFYKRVEEAAKAHQRQLKEMHKPQYSNFSYFGHKHKPKKHAPEKMRYCKECGLRH